MPIDSVSVHLATSAENEEGVKKANEMRVEFAKRSEIGNMHELTYDDELEKLADSFAEDCSFKNGNYDFLSLQDIKSHDFNAVRKLFHPLQTKIACVELMVPCPSRGIDSDGFCLIGPRSSEFSENDVKKGPLGSHCDHGVADNGLCKAVLKAAKSEKKYEEFAVTTETPVVHYEKQDPVEDKGAQTKAATQINSMILAVVAVILMIIL
ncbi:hypothetical protein CAEBREN_25880 [Caenorhabditis brenneri]|uniref:SCP domain-containing protein n=1 Tax=Caenorhabditis brenneri TaxID=135651 RepID=G0N2H8_CAEBE|nr:hypothetical protein CAEBREN_25880 [Caenorhabditis brenneri]